MQAMNIKPLFDLLTKWTTPQEMRENLVNAIVHCAYDMGRSTIADNSAETPAIYGPVVDETETMNTIYRLKELYDTLGECSIIEIKEEA